MSFLNKKSFSLADLVRASKEPERVKYLMSIYVGKQLSKQKNFKNDVATAKADLHEWLKYNNFDCDEAGDFCADGAGYYYDLFLFLRDLKHSNPSQSSYYTNIFLFYYPDAWY